MFPLSNDSNLLLVLRLIRVPHLVLPIGGANNAGFSRRLQLRLQAPGHPPSKPPLCRLAGSRPKCRGLLKSRLSARLKTRCHSWPPNALLRVLSCLQSAQHEEVPVGRPTDQASPHPSTPTSQSHINLPSLRSFLVGGVSWRVHGPGARRLHLAPRATAIWVWPAGPISPEAPRGVPTHLASKEVAVGRICRPSTMTGMPGAPVGCWCEPHSVRAC